MRDQIARISTTISASLKGSGPVGLIYVAAVVLVGAFVENIFALGLVLVWLVLSRTRLSEIGFKGHARPLATILAFVAVGVAIKFVMVAMVLPLVAQAPPVSPLLGSLRGDVHRALNWTWRVVLFGGVLEEIVYRGYLINRLEALLGAGLLARIVVVAISALAFGLPHYMEQGIYGAANATIGGAILATIYIACGRKILPVIVAHASNDICAIWIAFFGLNNWVIHSVWG